MSNKLINELLSMSEEERQEALQMFYSTTLDVLNTQTAASLIAQAVKGNFAKDKLKLTNLFDILATDKLQKATDDEFICLIYFDIVYQATSISQQEFDKFEETASDGKFKAYTGVLQA